jgi:hypothetical protein
MLGRFLIAVLALALVPGTEAAAGMQRQRPRSAVSPTPAPRVGAPASAASAVRLDGMTKEQVKSRLAALSDDAVVELKGRQMTKRQLLAEIDASRRKALDRLRRPPPKSSALEEKLSAAAADRRAKLQAANSEASAELLKAAGNVLPPCSSPKIAKVFLFSKITPGGFVAVKGCGFGSTPSGKSFVLELTKPPFNNITIKVTEWKDGLVSGYLPPDTDPGSGVTKVVDQPAHFKITSANGTTTSPDVSFVAARETKMLPFSALHVDCSTEADQESCDSGEFYGHTAHAYHATLWDPLGGDEGTDSYSATLKNGWRFIDMTWDPWGDGGYVSQGGFVKDSTSLSLQVKWNTGCGSCDAGYELGLVIEGPIGTSYK